MILPYTTKPSHVANKVVLNMIKRGNQLNILPPIAEAAVEKPKIKDEAIGEKEASKKIKSKKRSKSKKSKKTVEDTVGKEAAPSQMPESDIISPNLTLDNEVTAINIDQLNMVPTIAEAAVEKPVIKDEPKDVDRTVCFNLTNLFQMWRQTLNQGAFRRKFTVINWVVIAVQYGD
ncbi:hypothetical protein T05_8586 [Trichinella murrelli]|uniref:Uncharacterized protein n=1 Tax=Trichinella murrelli TaxID=144512 RepID=A0A0V0TM26_9BILA|nr:hypothetical protein T05_8586 [Trichinella murrelli]